MKVFLSYNFAHERFVQRVSYYLRTQPPLVPYCYADERKSGTWPKQIEAVLQESQVFVLFAGEKLGETQEPEAELAHARLIPHLLVVAIPQMGELPVNLNAFRHCDPIRVDELNEHNAQRCAGGDHKENREELGRPVRDSFGLPIRL